MYPQMVLFVTTSTLFFSPTITHEAHVLSEIPTTIKGEVIKNTMPFYTMETQENDYAELGEQGIRYFAHKYWMKKRTPKKLDLDSSEELIPEKRLDEDQYLKISKNERRNESMKQFLLICTQSFANVKLDYLIACALEGFKVQ